MAEKVLKEPIEEEPIIKEPIEKEPTLEEVKEQDICRERDAEEVRVHALGECGTPLKYTIIRSPRQRDEVVKIPEYYELKDGDEIIGLQRWGEQSFIQPRGTVVEVEDCVIVGERQRGE